MKLGNQSFSHKIIKKFYGVEIIDEYSVQIVHEIGNTCFLIYFVGSLLTAVLAIGVSTLSLYWAFHFLLGSQFLLMAVTLGYLSHRCQRLGLLDVEVLPEEYEEVKEKRLRRQWKQDLSFFVVYLLTTSFFVAGFDGLALLKTSFSIEKLLASAFFTGLMHVFTRRTLLKSIKIVDK